MSHGNGMAWLSIDLAGMVRHPNRDTAKGTITTCYRSRARSKPLPGGLVGVSVLVIVQHRKLASRLFI